MLEELSTLLDTVPVDAGRTDYLSAIVEENALAKQTGANRKITAQHLTELYALEPMVPLFRVLRRLWYSKSEGGRVFRLVWLLSPGPPFCATLPRTFPLN